MSVEEIINPAIPSLLPGDSAAGALRKMENAGLEALPLVTEEGVFRGMITESNLNSLIDRKVKLEELQPFGTANYVLGRRHIFDLSAIAQAGGISPVAVLSDEGRYMGSAGPADFAAAFGRLYSVQAPGSIIELTMYERDYSLSQIARLTESNGVKIIHAATDTDPSDAARIRLTLKLNQLDVSRVVATLERFGYNITALYNQADDQNAQVNPDRERLDSLLKYLSI
ncbi:MAG: CBS domain-containing protein [Bacteroidota bacterium]